MARVKRRRLAAAAAAAVALVAITAVSAGTAEAATTYPINAHIDGIVTGGQFSGQVTGGPIAGLTAEGTPLAPAGTPPIGVPACPGGNTFSGDISFSSGRDEVMIHYGGRLCVVSTTQVSFAGTWYVEGGLNAYSGASGSGTMTANERAVNGQFPMGVQLNGTITI